MITYSDTGWKVPSTNGDTNNQWSTPENAYLEDGNFATTAGADKTQNYKTFGFNIPNDAIIIGIEIKTLKGKISADQLLFKKRCERNGGLYLVINDPKDDLDNHADQLNPNNDEYWHSRE
jgi:hypothetical protein